jgi:hypothetical protein
MFLNGVKRILGIMKKSKPKFKIGDEVMDFDPHFSMGIIREVKRIGEHTIYGVHYYRYTRENPDDIIDSSETDIRLLTKLEKVLK